MDKYHRVATLSHFQELPWRSSLEAVSQKPPSDFLLGSGKIQVILAPCFMLKLMDFLQQITRFDWVCVCSDNIVNSCHQGTLEKSQ